ncbi:hypothetical protein OHA25_19395 [Nonomuraea sp. NBC_00507]|uniref:hypothetical protein n=1 Tax=Nonomuraea sp. NBC_00507 TaxID=2976002 RepID=UPI002E193E21
MVGYISYHINPQTTMEIALTAATDDRGADSMQLSTFSHSRFPTGKPKECFAQYADSKALILSFGDFTSGLA